MKLTIHTDGGARGNPGPAAIGVVIEEENKTIAEFGKTIGRASNNVAEYTAVIEALSYLNSKLKTQNSKLEVNFFLDSTLVVNQINGIYKVKEPHLRQLLLAVHTAEEKVGGKITYTAVRREFNTRADYFVNDALDRQGQ